MSYNNISFILHRPQPENIGACARAIKIFSFINCYNQSKPVFPNDKILATSVGAKDIINKAKVFDNLEDNKYIDILVATSARFRNKNIKHISVSDLQNIDFSKKLVFYLDLKRQVYQIMKLVMQILLYKYQQIKILSH